MTTATDDPNANGPPKRAVKRRRLRAVKRSNLTVHAKGRSQVSIDTGYFAVRDAQSVSEDI